MFEMRQHVSVDHDSMVSLTALSSVVYIPCCLSLCLVWVRIFITHCNYLCYLPELC